MLHSAKLPLSVFIIALNEGDRIARAIESVRDWVSEVIVIDSGSTDDTRTVCESLGAHWLFNAWPGYGLQKRFGEDQCHYDWLLNIDADEVIPEALATEIQALFNGPTSHQGYHFKIVEIMPGESKPRRFAHSITAIRLYDRRAGRFSDSSVHDTVRMERGTVATLTHIVEHRSSRSIAHSIEKLNRYSTMQAQNLADRGVRLPFLYVRLLVEFPISFLKAYLLRGYFFKGWPGFTNAIIYAFSRFARIAKHVEKTQGYKIL